VTDAEFRERTATELMGWEATYGHNPYYAEGVTHFAGWSTPEGCVVTDWYPDLKCGHMHQALRAWCRLQDGRWVDHTYGPVFKHVPVGGRDDDRVALGQHAVVVVQCYGNTFLAAARAALEQAMGGET